MSRGVLVRFIASTVLGVVMAVGLGIITARPQITSTARSDQPVALTGAAGEPLEFSLVAADPKPIAPLPATATIQLTSFTAPASPAPDGEVVVPEPWWDASSPRVPAVTQFDGGPLQAVNCTMAAGAMLARLGYGVVTTGSQLRALQDDQDGGSSFQDLGVALSRGWGIDLARGSLSPLQLRAVLYAGAGAVISGLYGEIPVNLRLQGDFLDPHAIYVDAFRPAGPSGPAAYYVMDPIGRTWQGYRGAWWPADVVEGFATTFGRGRIHAAWAFPGGVAPRNHPVLPRDAYPTDSGPPDPSPGTSLPPGASSPPFDPMPSAGVPPTADPPVGEPPSDVPDFGDIDFSSDIFEVKDPGTLSCLVEPPPLGCPRGIRGIVDIRDATVDTGTGEPGQDIKALYADAIAPGTYQIVIEAPRDTESELWFWTAGGALQAATVDEALLDGKRVSVATVTLDPGADFSFLATASGDGVRAISTVGSMDVGS